MTPSLPAFAIAFIAAFLFSAVLAPIVGMLARRFGIVDRPDGHRKLHSEAVPLTGGPTLLLSGIFALAVTVWFHPDLFESTAGDIKFLASLLVASVVIVAVGLLDDRFKLRGRQKLFGQFLAAVIMVPSGIMIDRIQLFGVPIEFGDLSALVTLFWILGAVNALNLIDGVDGLASTTGIVLSLSVAAVTLIMGGRPDGLVMALILAGSLVGFLIYNFPPARMFLGDSGSMLIGLVLGCIALKCSLKQYTAAALIMPTAIWAIPIFDVCMAIVRRKLTGRSIYATDRAHLHHCLMRQGHSGRTLLLIVGSLCAITGLGAVLSAAFGSDLIAIVGIMTAITLLVVTRSFGHAELKLMTNRIRRLAGSMLKRPAADGSSQIIHNERVRLHGDHQWEDLWLTLTEFAEQYDMDCVELMVNAPSVGEAYHAVWQRKSETEPHEAWRSEIPLIVEGMRVGQIKAVGAAGDGSICEWMSNLIGGLRPFELQLVSLIQELRERKSPRRAKVINDSGLFQLPQRASV